MPVSDAIDTPAETTPVEYRDVPGFPGYRVGSDGSVWSRKSGGWSRLKLATNRGYQQVSLSRWARHSSFKVHHLVLENFVGPRPPGLECRHLDGNPANNRLDNLCWGTRAENVADQVRHGTQLGPRGERCAQSVLTTESIGSIRRLYRSGLSQAQIARMFNVHRITVWRIFAGKTWRHVHSVF